jgi:ribonuclease P protein component
VKQGDERFPKSLRLRKRREFLAVQRRGIRFVTDHFVVYARSAAERDIRLGITVSRKVGRAHTRNRVKRHVREAFRRKRIDLPLGLNLVFVARQGRGLADYETVESEMVTAITHLKAKLARPAKNRKRRGRG